jgi:hypothetical protein
LYQGSKRDYKARSFPAPEAVEQSGNTVAAYLGEIEDRLERAGGGKS